MATPFGYKPRISQRFIGDSSIHRVDGQSMLARMAVSTGWQGYATLSTCWIRPWRKLVADLIRNPEGKGMVVVILALRQYPQRGATTRHPNHQSPLSLDGRGIKGEGEQDNTLLPGPSYWL